MTRKSKSYIVGGDVAIHGTIRITPESFKDTEPFTHDECWAIAKELVEKRYGDKVSRHACFSVYHDKVRDEAVVTFRIDYSH